MIYIPLVFASASILAAVTYYRRQQQRRDELERRLMRAIAQSAQDREGVRR